MMNILSPLEAAFRSILKTIQDNRGLAYHVEKV